jgi:ADP-heptose:LPS heptosyltransferase
MNICIVSNTADLGVMVVRNLLIKLIREKYPNAKIVLMAEAEIIDKVRAFYESCSWVDEFLAIEPKRSLAQQLKLWWRLLVRHFAVIIFEPRSKVLLRLAYSSGIPVRVGLYFDPGQSQYLTHPVKLELPAGEEPLDLHWSEIIAGYARALQIDNFTQVSDHVPFIRFGRGGVSNRNNAVPKIVVHAGGNPEWNRRWPLEKYSDLCCLLALRADVAIVLVGGRDEAIENKAIMERVLQANPSARIGDVSGCAINEMVDHIAWSDLFIGNDSGPMNVAVAVGTPVVVIRGADSEIFRPDVIDGKHVVVSNWVNCSRLLNDSNICKEGCPVGYDRVRQDYAKCMEAISLETVWRSVEQKLQALPGRAYLRTLT